MAEPLLAVADLVRRFGGLVASDHINLEIGAGEIHAIIGPNGAGKSTLVAQLAGELRPDHGTIHFAGQDVTHLPVHARVRRGFSRSFQITSIFHDLTALTNVALAVQARAGHSFHFFSPARRESALIGPARELLDQVGLGDQADTLAGHLAYGDKRGLEIAMVLATRPRLLMLDEPMAGMGLDDSARLVRYLATLRGRFAILLVEHDMDAVFALADRITVLVNGRVIATGTPSAIRANEDVRRAYLGDDEMP